MKIALEIEEKELKEIHDLLVRYSNSLLNKISKDTTPASEKVELVRKVNHIRNKLIPQVDVWKENA